ncbi:DVU0772 family protein [Desulfoscipio sp. XC116]|uniref:DVU0772 family protein n=1 Tax=Desulfoscipio sp. XC116 TaxID=3144975 RepID=UPI00325C1022
MDIFKEIKDEIFWDFRLENENKNRQPGYAFVIDVIDQTPRVALYIVKKHLSKTQTLPSGQQPPGEMLLNALQEQNANLKYDNIYNINREIRQWLEQNIF